MHLHYYWKYLFISEILDNIISSLIETIISTKGKIILGLSFFGFKRLIDLTDFQEYASVN